MNTRYVSEFLGLAALLTVIVGSGIMGENLSKGNEAIALLANSLATGAGLYVLILVLAPISGAHLNPAVSLFELLCKRLRKADFIAYITAQFSGAILGVWLSHAMFRQPILQASLKTRSGLHLAIAELVATLGLISVATLTSRKRPESTPAAVALYILSAYWFTSSTSFANPAATLARSMTDSFSGTALQSTPPFFLAQLVAAMLAVWLARGHHSR